MVPRLSGPGPQVSQRGVVVEHIPRRLPFGSTGRGRTVCAWRQEPGCRRDGFGWVVTVARAMPAATPVEFHGA